MGRYRTPRNEPARTRPATPGLFPETERLTSALAAVLQSQGVGRLVLVLGRQLNRHSMTFPSEVVTCELDDGRRLQLFCKYSDDEAPDVYRARWHGHRRGVRYEAEVYEKLLQPIGALRARFYGLHDDMQTQRSLLVLDYLDGWRRLHKTRRGMVQAARWAGHFHRTVEDGIPALDFLTCYDAAYFLGWVRRTCEFAQSRRSQFPWLEALESRAPQAVDLLLACRQTVLHGEYFPRNILCLDGEISPVDWESAAVGPGELDLAALTEGWRGDVVAECKRAYLEARWPGGPPDGWSGLLSAARLIHNFRWLGQCEDWTLSAAAARRFKALRAAGTALELLR